jgi:hypothetical protein
MGLRLSRAAASAPCLTVHAQIAYCARHPAEASYFP